MRSIDYKMDRSKCDRSIIKWIDQNEIDRLFFSVKMRSIDFLQKCRISSEQLSSDFYQLIIISFDDSFFIAQLIEIIITATPHLPMCKTLNH
jgi:hypothetical protein